MRDLPLTPEQEALADVLYQRFQQAFDQEARQLARLLASKDDAHLLGATEFELRDRVLRLGAQALQTALGERKKGGTRGPARPARAAAKRPSASPSAPGTSSP
jgi:hypothetical protein